jgi:hypothetical protein
MMTPFGTIDRLCHKVMDSIFSYQTGCDDLIIGIDITAKFHDYKFTYFTEDSDPENGDDCPSYVREFDVDYLNDKIHTCFDCLVYLHENVTEIKTACEVNVKIIKLND